MFSRFHGHVCRYSLYLVGEKGNDRVTSLQDSSVADEAVDGAVAHCERWHSPGLLLFFPGYNQEYVGPDSGR